MLDPRTVSMAYVRSVLAAVEACGVRPELVLQDLSLDLAALEQPDARLAVSDVRRIWERALALTGDGLLGLKTGQSMKPGTFRVLGLATMSCATLQQAIGVMLRYQRLVSESGTLTTRTLDDGRVAILHTEMTRRALLPQQIEAVLAGIYHQARWLSGREALPVEISFRHAPLGPLAMYERCFGLAPRFGEEDDVLVFAQADVQAPLPYADADLCRMHCALADSQLALLPQAGMVGSFAMQWIATQPNGTAKLEDLAVALGMSVRSLQRAFKDEGKSWSELIDAARRAALQGLLQQGVSLADAAQRLGYHDASSVSRAARRWFGTTPGQWRGQEADKT
jgi:AraC-like DNA-binding protein